MTATSFDFRRSFLGASAFNSNSSKDVYTGSFDLLVASSSWDRRCTVISKSDSMSIGVGLLILFEKRDSTGLQDAHDSELLERLPVFCEQFQKIEHESDLHSTWEKILNVLITTYNRKQKPLRVFVDLATMPRFFSLGLLAHGLKHGLVEHMTFGYSEGKYTNLSGNHVEWFTEGGWDTVSIPGLEGEWEPQNKSLFVVSIGFEGAKIQRLITKAEPDRVAVLYPDPPVQPDYADEVARNNRTLTKDFGITDDEIVRAHAANPVTAWQNLDDKSLESFERENCYYACCGPKPHSLAIALRAISTGVGAVMYVVPDSHRVSDIQPNGTYWQYTVRDHSVLGHDSE